MFERCLYFNVNALARRVNRVWEEAFKPFGLSPAHAYLLRLALAHPGLLQKEIAGELGVAPSTVTRFVDALEERGLLKRSQTGVEDAREFRIVPTAKARKLHEALEQTGETLYRDMLADIGDDELKRLVGELRRAQEKLGHTD